MSTRDIQKIKEPSFGQQKGGFSVLEIIFALAIFASISLVVINLKSSVGIIDNLVNQRLQSQQDMNQAFQIFSNAVRSAGPSSIGAYPIEAASTSSFSFYSDVDKDGLFERVRYFLVTSTVQQGIIKPAGNPLVYTTSTETTITLIANVTQSTSTAIFSYYDSTYTGSEAALTLPIDASKVRAVKISVYIDPK